MGDILLGARRLGRSKTLKDGTAGSDSAAAGGGIAAAGGGIAAAGGEAQIANLKSIAPMEKSQLIGR
jgi:hypothetical protein